MDRDDWRDLAISLLPSNPAVLFFVGLPLFAIIGLAAHAWDAARARLTGGAS